MKKTFILLFLAAITFHLAVTMDHKGLKDRKDQLEQMV